MSEHGFKPQEEQAGRHTSGCRDHLCDGCVDLEICATCGRLEFEHDVIE